MAANVASGTIGSAAIAGSTFTPLPSNWPNPAGFNVSVYGTFVATVALVKSFDAGVTWIRAAASDGSAITFTQPATTTFLEFETGVRYALSCAVADGGAYTSGTVNWRISQ